MTDVLLEHTDDGGEVEIAGGRVTVDDGPATAAYLSLFGGNEADAGTSATASSQWWGNLLETDQKRRLRSETQHLLRALPATTGNLARIATAVDRDLAWMVDELGAAIDVEVTMPSLNRVSIAGTIIIDGRTTELRLAARWGSS